jgi:hypothetical protein
VYVAIVADKQTDRAHVSSGFPVPAAQQELHSYVVIDGRTGQPYDTSFWQRWNLDEAGYRSFLQPMATRSDAEKYARVGVERLIDRLSTRGPAPEVPWWRPAELRQNQAGDSGPLEGFRNKNPALVSMLVIGRVGNVFRCYAYTQRNVLAPDPREAIRRLLGLELPPSASEVRYQSDSNPAGIVYLIRFDLLRHDFVTRLAQASLLPPYATFTADAAVRKYLETAYQTGAPEWWHPEELDQGIYAQRRSNAKDLSNVSIGLGHRSDEIIRVYIGGFSAW